MNREVFLTQVINSTVDYFETIAKEWSEEIKNPNRQNNSLNIIKSKHPLLPLIFFGALLKVAAVTLGNSSFENIGGENQRIVGGTHVRENELPHQVYLEILVADDGLNFKFYACGGTIISTKFILTAAHCMYGSVVDGGPKLLTKAEIILVHIGIVDLKLRQENTAVRVNRMIIHKKYNISAYDYDIALLELCEPLTLTESVNVLPIATTQDVVFKRVEVSGWGLTNKRSPLTPNADEDVTLLSKVTLDLVPRSKCQTMHSTYKSKDQVEQTAVRNAIIPIRTICAKGQNRGDCQGDSGGPLTCHVTTYPFQKRLCGIVSSGLGCAWPGLPGVYMNTRNVEMNNWIYANAKVSTDKASYCPKIPTGDIIPNK